VNFSFFLCFAASRTRSSDWDTSSRFCARNVLRASAFPSVPALGSTRSAADRTALFASFIATMAGSDFSSSFIIGYGSSPSRCGPKRPEPFRPTMRPPRFRRVPFARDAVFDPGRASTPRITGPHILPSTEATVSASAMSGISRLNVAPHAIAVYASRPPSPTSTQHSLPSASYGLLGPDFHRLDRAD
jgi:hypothetical protein